MKDRSFFLPVSRKDMEARGWYYYDFLLVTGDAYIDHPSFGTAVISRVLEKAGYRVAILSQPDYRETKDFVAMGAPRLGVLINAGNIDSMVAHFTAAKRRRRVDAYTPGGKPGRRPDRAVIVYSRLAREAFPDKTIVIGGLEASLRRFAHYDYWDDDLRPAILAESDADILSYGMGERSMVEIAACLKNKGDWRNIRGICHLGSNPEECRFENSIILSSFEEVRDDKRAYAQAALVQQNENDSIRGHALLQQNCGKWLIQNPPAYSLEGEELDKVYALPYARAYHPDYEALGGVAAIEEVKFSIIHNRGCYGSCNFCALSMHQGRRVTSRSHSSVLGEAEKIIADPDFKGYIHDVGGPTANFRREACKKQRTEGACVERQCLFPTPCPNLDADHKGYLTLLRRLRQMKGVKKVFIRSGIRFDYMLHDKDRTFFEELVQHHISGQLKVAPEHISPRVLGYMGKPYFDVYERFCREFKALNERYGKEQYLVPYLMSSHPGSTLDDAIALAMYLKENRLNPQQVQDFYPTPGSLSTAMYYTGYDPRTMEPVYVARTPEEKSMQWALLQYGNPKNRQLVIAALRKAGREDLIGSGKNCLVPVPRREWDYREKPSVQKRGQPGSQKNQGHKRGSKPFEGATGAQSARVGKSQKPGRSKVPPSGKPGNTVPSKKGRGK